VDIVNISVAELGFKKGAILRDIYKRALEFDLKLCHAEVGPLLCLQADQPTGELLIVMKPIIASDGNLYVFFVFVKRDGSGLWIDGQLRLS
jgi:hypothetical protein